jgi:hypothetical protein
MTTNEKENNTGESSGISQRRSEGVAGPSREVSKRELVVPGADGTGQENEELAWAKQHVPEEPEMLHGKREPAPRLVERKTELRGLGIGARHKQKSTVRRRTEQDLSGSDPEVPYAKTERAIRDLVCSLMERQDRMNEVIFLKLNDLGYRFDDLEADVEDLQERGRS